MKKIGGYILGQAIMLGLFLVLVHPAQAATATVSGTVKLSTTNVGVDSILVYVENYATGEQDYAYTDASGNYTITVGDAATNTAGTYSVYNSYYSYVDTASYYIKQTQAVTLSNGENKSAVNFTVDKQGKITGYVYAKDGVTPLYNSSMFTSATINGVTFYGSDYTTAAGYYIVTPYNYQYSDTANNGSYLVTASLAGYFGSSQTIAVAKNTTVTANFTLTRGSVVSGNITDTAGAAIAGATATLAEVGTTRTYTAVTDSAGNYSVLVYDSSDYGGTAVGYYNLSATATNYVSQSSGIHITADESTLSANNFSLATAGTITGTIFQADGTTPLSGATIMADDGYGHTASTTSASNGTYTLASLRTSTNYTITTSKDGYVTQKAYHVTVATGATTADQNFSLATSVSFSGTVTDETTATGIDGATIYLYNLAKPRYTSYVYDYTVTTHTNGSFIVPNIVPGNYRVRVVKAGYTTVRSRKIDITNTVTDQAYTMSAATSIFGKITHKQQPVYNALVSVYSQQDTDVGYGSVYSDAQGFYTIPNLKPGSYLLRVVSTGYADKIIKRTIKKTTTRVNIKVGVSGTVTGFVYDSATQLPLAGYTIKVRDRAVSTSTDSNGYYLLDGLAVGDYTLYITSTLYDTVTNKNVKVKANKETKNVNFNLTPKE